MAAEEQRIRVLKAALDAGDGAAPVGKEPAAAPAAVGAEEIPPIAAVIRELGDVAGDDTEGGGRAFVLRCPEGCAPGDDVVVELPVGAYLAVVADGVRAGDEFVAVLPVDDEL